ncbi:MAG: GNAT family N-acetyltransferase [Nitrosomonas sp.]
MNSQPIFKIQLVTWENEEPHLRNIRTTVFIIEQNVPEVMEWDEMDSVCVHVLAQDCQGNAIGTARLLPDGHIGRMAVLKTWRKKGVGSAMLQAILNEMRIRNMRQAVLHAQSSAVGFYEKFGFCKQGDEFMEADIPHIKMARTLP